MKQIVLISGCFIITLLIVTGIVLNYRITGKYTWKCYETLDGRIKYLSFNDGTIQYFCEDFNNAGWKVTEIGKYRHICGRKY